VPISALKYALPLLGFPRNLSRKCDGPFLLIYCRRPSGIRSEERVMYSLMEVMPASHRLAEANYWSSFSFQDRLLDRDCRRDGWLEFSDWLAHRQIGNAADGLVQISD
jgi:hypothetical protein